MILMIMSLQQTPQNQANLFDVPLFKHCEARLGMSLAQFLHALMFAVMRKA